LVVNFAVAPQVTEGLPGQGGWAALAQRVELGRQVKLALASQWALEKPGRPRAPAPPALVAQDSSGRAFDQAQGQRGLVLAGLLGP
jgi:hypothetical protein